MNTQHRLQPELKPNPRVVLAESDEDTRQLYREALSSLTTDVVDASDGRDALVQCLLHPPALVITDTRLPYVDGFALCELLRCDLATRSVPILVVTAEVRPAELVLLRRLGASILAKPVDVELLRAEVGRLRDATDVGGASERLPEDEPRTRFNSTATRSFRRFETTTPAMLPPVLRCPHCDRFLEFRKSRIGGVTRRDAEQWDEFSCPDCKAAFEYRHRTRKVRAIR